MENQPNETSSQDHVKLALAELRKLIVQRNRELAEREIAVLKAVFRKRSKNALKAKLKEGMSSFHMATIHMEAKIARRCLFHLRERERHLCAKLGESPMVLIDQTKHLKIEDLRNS
jgi:hypothetical protein